MRDFIEGASFIIVELNWYKVKLDLQFRHHNGHIEFLFKQLSILLFFNIVVIHLRRNQVPNEQGHFGNESFLVNRFMMLAECEDLIFCWHQFTIRRIKSHNEWKS